MRGFFSAAEVGRFQCRKGVGSAVGIVPSSSAGQSGMGTSSMPFKRANAAVQSASDERLLKALASVRAAYAASFLRARKPSSAFLSRV